MQLVTQRLTLRPWQESDRAPFAAMSVDPDVMRHLTSIPTVDAANAWIDRQIAHEAQHHFCFWAVADRVSGTFLGAVGLLHVSYEAPFTPAVEVGWRFARHAWGHGYATEAALASLRFGFEHAGLTEIVANAGRSNLASHRVMQKLGMTRDPLDDFDHPRLPVGDPLRRQVLYRISHEAWRGQSKTVETSAMPPP